MFKIVLLPPGRINDSNESSSSSSSATSASCPSSSFYTLDNSTIDSSSTVSDNSSITDNSSVDNSTVRQCSRIVSCRIDNSTISNSTLSNCTITNSTIDNSTIDNSTIDNSTIDNSTISNDNVTDKTINGSVAPKESDTVPFDDGSGQQPNISITFSESVDTTTVTTNTGDTSCSGSIQLSTDSNFGTCIQMDSPSVSNGNKTITISPGSKLSCGVLVYFRITTTVKDASGNNLSAPIVKSFTTCS